MFSCIRYESDNNVVSQRLVENVQLPTSFHPNQAKEEILTAEGMEIEEKENEVKKKMMEKVVEKQGV